MSNCDGNNSTLYILYGSATGNAEGISKDLEDHLNENKAKNLPKPFQRAVCWELNQFKKCLKEWAVAPSGGQKHGAILVSSTTGNGDAPENAGRFTRYIKKQNKDASNPKPFEHLAYSVLALGDTNYDQFCATGKLIDRMVDSLGGTRAKPLVCADEGTGLLEEVVDPWMETVVQEVAKACLGSSVEEEKVEESNDENLVLPPKPPAPETSPSPLYIMYGSATGNAEAIAKDLATTYQMILQNPDSKTYFPDVVCAELNGFKKMKLAEEVWNQPPVPGNSSVKHGLLVVASTTGNGDAPENSDKFLRYLKKSARAATKDPSLRPFQHVAFAVLGLGDTNYDQYCQHAKLLNKYLEELGGTPIRPLTCADEGTGQLEDVVDGWTANILMEVTDASRGPVVESVATTGTQSKREKITPQEEEKKMEPLDEVFQSMESASPGVTMVSSLINLSDTTQVDSSTLPKLTHTSQANTIRFVPDTTDINPESCENDDQSEDGAFYTLERPFESTMVGARYLTATPSDAANEICEMRAGNGSNLVPQEVLDRSFPLQIDGSVSRNGKRVIELALSLPDDQSWEYKPGDSLGLIVGNTPEAVGFIMNMLQSHHGISSLQKISVDSTVLTVKQLVTEKIDLCTVLKNRKILFALSQICTDPREKFILELMSSKTKQGSDLMETFIQSQRRSVVDILKEFPSCQGITLDNLVSLLPPIPPRYYSVSSSPLDSKGNQLTVAFSVVDYLTPSLVDGDGKQIGCRRIHGLATSHLESLCSPFLSSKPTEPTTPSTLKIFPKPTEDFHLPADPAIPLVLIGPGTGIAPFMGFFAHRKALSSQQTEGTVGSVEVFFGCRHSDHDYLYQNELEAFVKDGVIDHLNVAFSRDGPTKQYVQDIMTSNKECSERLADIVLNSNGRVYVCGDGNHMGRDVQTSLSNLLGSRLGSQEMGTSYVEQMKSTGRFLLDIWS